VVFWRLYKAGLLDSEFDQIVPLYTQAYPPVSMHFVKAPTKPLEDLSGLKFIASGKIPTQVVQRLGGSPLSIGLTDSYQALQRSTADGINFPMDNSGEAESRRAGKILDDLGKEETERLSHQADQTVVSLSAEQDKKWGAALGAIASDWAATDAQHKAVLAKVRELAAQVKTAAP